MNILGLRKRLDAIETRRAAGTFEIVREHPTGGATLTVIRHGRVGERRELAVDAAGRGADEVVIERSYGCAG